MEYEQMDIFSFIEPQEQKQEKFCWDDDINEIIDKLNKYINKHSLTKGKTEWEVWSHVPQYGFRLTYEIKFKRSEYTDELLEELNKIVEFAKERNVELSPIQMPFFGNKDESTIHIYSTFMDNQRRKRNK